MQNQNKEKTKEELIDEFVERFSDILVAQVLDEEKRENDVISKSS